MKINEKNLCAFATTPPYDLEGVLSKRGEVNKAWQKRYFVLKGNLLFYFEKKGDREPTGLIIVEGCTIELCEEETEPYCFQIIFNGNRTYTLSAESQDIMETWMKALTCASYEYKKLMVAELQRQLEEIEGIRKKYNQETIQRAAPKPPPRRQNPFNRPAPPPPVLNSNAPNPSVANNNIEATSTAGVSTISTTGTAMTTTAVDNNESCRQTLLDAELNDFVNIHNLESQSSAPSSYQRYQQQTNNDPKSDISNFSFRTVHEEFRKQFLADERERRRRKEVAEAPLIDI
ncbi:unnamed protein product [Hermetia illucens]|uniref:PH domain-containing protein n=1 Tax=Hermetia illucens TaxID=343691 RepID=A0A7R8V2R2_HERIL|nr:sesquipedalian-1 isoform X1 [Hermetia illucens]CAD7091125.1 unnamed protein product [Hermetia illucens]